MSEKLFVDRPPRIQPELPEGEFTVPAPPDRTEREQSLLQLLLPTLAVLGYVIFLLVGGGRSLLLAIPMLVIAGMSSLASWLTGKRSRLEKEEQAHRYRERLSQIRQTLTQQQQLQRQFYYHNHPNPAQVLKMATVARQQARQNRQHISPRLWERRPGDADFGMLRLGIGSRPATVRYKVAEGNSLDDPLYQEAERIVAESAYVSDVPLTITLRPVDKEQQATHALGVTGRNEAWVYRSAWSLIANFVTFHAPNDARVLLLGSDKAESKWRWATELPHTQPQNDFPICFESVEDALSEKEGSDVYRFLKELRQLLDKRRQLLDEREGDPDQVRLPFVLVVVDLLAPLTPASRLRELEADSAISTLMERGAELGAAILFLVSAPSKVPSGCQAILEIHEESNERQTLLATQGKVLFRYAETGVNGVRYLGEADYHQNQKALYQFAKTLGSLQVRQRYGQDLPFPLRLFDLLTDVKTVEDLRDFAAARWRESADEENADWLNAPLGVMSGGERRVLKLSADADGVHGLIAGSTGSGKSELLISLILGLAVHYDPTILNFVLVDFKGGGAFKPLETLPHVVKVVTNLKASAVDRMFASIRAELDRRQHINTYTNTSDLVEYRERGLHLPDANGNYGQPVVYKDAQLQTAPYPHLIIIIDEFAEMIEKNKEYKAELESITRLGRALGVTLILAAQKPTGVTDQMRANIKFRIALRVEDREDSMLVLHRPDAAHLPNGVPGRGYLQVGYDNLELIQVAWSGEEYKGVRKTSPDVIWLDRMGQTHSEREAADPPKVYEEVVRVLTQLAESASLPQQAPWPDFLPERMSLQTLVDTAYLEDEFGIVENETTADEAKVALNPHVEQWWSGEREQWPVVDWSNQAMRAVIGLIDNPQRSEQRPLYIDFRRGHAVVFGASGWGKTTFLRTTLTTLLTTHSPNVLQVYILDFGSRQFSVFRHLPHVGAVITADEGERTQRLLRRLDNVLDERKQLLGESDYADIYAYNADHASAALPALLVIIDNFAEFRDSYDTLLPSLISIVRESRAYGVHFAISAELPHTVSGKLYSVLTERFALTLSVETEYTNIVGRNVTNLAELPGRGFLRQERHILEFQVAFPIGTTSDLADERENEKLRELVTTLGRAAHVGGVAPPIKILSHRIYLNSLVPPKQEQTTIAPIIGVDDLSLQPWQLDLKRFGPHCLVLGGSHSGKTTLLRTLILSLAATYTPDEVALMIVDFQGSLTAHDGAFSLAELPHVVATLPNSDHFQAFAKQLATACNALKATKGKRIFVIMDNYERINEELQENRGVLFQLALLARDFGPEGLHIVLAGAPEIAKLMGNRFARQIYSSRFGIGLDQEGAERLNARVSGALLQETLPIGRGYVVKSGKATVVQFATPYREETVAQSLDSWIGRLMRGDSDLVEEASVEPAPIVIVEGEQYRRDDLNGSAEIDIAHLRQQIETDYGFSVATLNAEGVIDVAISLGLKTP